MIASSSSLLFWHFSSSPLSNMIMSVFVIMVRVVLKSK
jgi:hypothetical protein